LQLPTDWTTLFDPDAGCLFVEACVQAQLAAAEAAGAEFQPGTVVREISCRGTGIELTTDPDRVAASIPIIHRSASQSGFQGMASSLRR
jgi:glycine/D-amino acid oxidase-like deaminating enzyme